MIIEYKLVREQGEICTPSWVLDGGYFYDPVKFTYIGTTENDGVRAFYLPDTVVRLTRQQLVERASNIFFRHPRDMNAEIHDALTMVEAWCDERGE